ncbi:MAG: hypothetical protein ABSC55_16710 [Syntrophorhabdales bacterium]|jgi:hypothetical protein
MRSLAIALLVATILGCAHTGAVSVPGEEKAKEYSTTAVSLSDFSMKIIAYYQSQNLPIPNDFDATQFFALLEKIYPDQPRVQAVRNSYRVSVHPIDGGYSVMLCDPQTDRKIMEDLSCHLDRVEIRSWESGEPVPCAFDASWKPRCE